MRDKIPSEILKQLREEQPAENAIILPKHQISHFSRFLWVYSAAAGLITIFVISLLLLNSKSASDELTAELQKYMKKNTRRGNVEWSLSETGKDQLTLNIQKLDLNDNAADVFHNFLTVCKFLQTRSFGTLFLANNGKTKFQIDGDYAREIGKKYAAEESIGFIFRTFPSNVKTIDGKQRFTSSGTTADYENLNTFHNEWYKNDIR